MIEGTSDNWDFLIRLTPGFLGGLIAGGFFNLIAGIALLIHASQIYLKKHTKK